jgi:hypothetical protein
MIIATFTIYAMLFWGALRMRVPIEPLVALYAAAGLDETRRLLMSRRRGLRVVEGRTRT